jgi:hypothetical protein
MPFAIVKEQPRASADGVDQQVKSPITVHIGKNCPRRALAGASDAGLIGNVFKPPTAEVPIQAIVSFKTAEIQIAPAVAVDISSRDARAI